MADAHKNAAYSLVATAPSPATSGTSLVVTAGEGGRFPTPPFNATVWASGAQPTFVAGGTTGGNFEIVRVTAISTDTFTITRAQESSSARTVVVGDQIAATVTVKTLTDAENTPYSARSSNTILALADKGSSIVATAGYTQTFTAAATLGAGWWCVLTNGTQDGTSLLVVDPNASETVDALTTMTMYSGESRLIECDGSNFFSQMIDGGYAKFAATGSFIVPAGLTALDVVCVGSGGQGGGGFTGSGSGGGGGGGGSVARAILRASDFSAGGTVTVTVAAGGTGSGAAGNAGANGGQTSFGTSLNAFGGGGGGAGLSAANSIGGGGGSMAASGATTTAGSPSSATAIGGQSGTSAAATAGKPTEWGGAGGGGSTSAGTGLAGGGSVYGGPGGGGGHGAALAGAAGGNTQSYASGGGGSGGAGATSGTATKGTDGTFTGPYCGTGGGGGGGNSGGTGGAGGVGSIGAGGGGGGHGSVAGGAGGGGGAGECRVYYS